MSRLSPAVYWRRRLLVLAAVFLLGWVVTTLVSGDEERSAAPEPSPTTTASPEAEPTAAPTPTPAPSPTLDTATEVALTTDRARCDPSTVRIQPTVPAGQQAGKVVRVDFLVTTTAEKPCTLVPKGRETLVVVSSGDSTVWDSSACSDPVLTGPVALVPGWATLARGADEGLSAAGCVRGEGLRYAATYQVRAALLGGEPSETTFELDGLTRAELREKQEQARAAARKKAAAAKKKAAEERAARKKAAAKKRAEERERAEADRRRDDDGDGEQPPG